MNLSRSAIRWRDTMRKIYSMDIIIPVIHRAECLARLRGGRMITRADLDFAIDMLAKESWEKLDEER